MRILLKIPDAIGVEREGTFASIQMERGTSEMRVLCADYEGAEEGKHGEGCVVEIEESVAAGMTGMRMGSEGAGQIGFLTA